MPCNWNPCTGEVETIFERYQREAGQMLAIEELESPPEKQEDPAASESTQFFKTSVIA